MLTGTTVAASQMLNTTQPSISRLISQIQNSSGLDLFKNDRGRLKLTQEGNHLFNTIQLNFKGLDHIEQAISSLKSSGQGVFRIACTPSLAQSIIPTTIKQFSKSHPNTHFNIHALSSHNIREGLRQGYYDIAVTNSDNLFDTKEFKIKQIHQSEAVCIFKKGHKFSKLKYVSIDNLGSEPRICLPSNDQLEIELANLLQQKKIVPVSPIETNYSSTICTFVSKGIGYGIINPYMASVFSNQLLIRPFLPQIIVNTFAIFSRFSPVSEFSEKFLTVLLSQVEVN